MSAYLANRGCGWQDEALVMIIRFADNVALKGYVIKQSSLFLM